MRCPARGTRALRLTDEPVKLHFRRPESYAELEPLVEALGDDLGPQFEQSLRVWCGLKPAPYPLEQWEIEIARDHDDSNVGILGYYRHPQDRPGRFWVGWLGVVPAARRRGIGALLLQRVQDRAAGAGATELWVYTEADNHAAASFYRAQGMTPQGPFGSQALPQAAATEDSVTFAKSLSR